RFRNLGLAATCWRIRPGQKRDKKSAPRGRIRHARSPWLRRETCILETRRDERNAPRAGARGWAGGIARASGYRCLAGRVVAWWTALRVSLRQGQASSRFLWVFQGALPWNAATALKTFRRPHPFGPGGRGG